MEKLVTSKTLSEQISRYKRGESLFYYDKQGKITTEKGGSSIRGEQDENGARMCSSDFVQYIPAYTATELGELMKDVDFDEFRIAHQNLFNLESYLKGDMLLFTNPESLGQIFLYLLKSGVIK